SAVGHGRERQVRLLGGAVARLRPGRARCRSCGRTPARLLAWCAPRRADGIEVIGAALAVALGGAGSRRIGASLGVPAATVRGWLGRLRSRAEEMRHDAMATWPRSAAAIPRCPHRPPPPLGD